MAEKTTPGYILDIIDRANTQLAATPPPEPLTCNQGHNTERLYYRRPFQGSPDTIIACRTCDHDNATDQQQHPEPTDPYEN